MADLLSFLRECAASGALLGSLCGALVVPFFAWLAIRPLAPHIARMRDDAGWQAPLAAIAAVTPAAMFLALGIVGVRGAASAGCLHYFWGRVMFATIVALLFLALCRASAGAYRRARQIRNLTGASQPPDAALKAIADRCRVRVRVLKYSGPFCALAGLWRPVVLVSTESRRLLSDDELEAALLHERAHAARFDLVLGAALAFFAELLPLWSDDLAATYAKAREIAADERAVRSCAADTLASAIVRLASLTRLAHAAVGLAEGGRAVTQRVAALLDGGGACSPPIAGRLVSIMGLSAIVAASIAPAVVFSSSFAACVMTGVHP